MDEDWLEGSLGSGGAETGDDAGDLLEGVGTVEMPSKVNKLYKKREKVKHSGNHQFDDGGEACSGTEGLNVSSRAIDDSEVSNIKGERPSPQGQRKESKKLYFGGNFVYAHYILFSCSKVFHISLENDDYLIVTFFFFFNAIES